MYSQNTENERNIDLMVWQCRTHISRDIIQYSYTNNG